MEANMRCNPSFLLLFLFSLNLHVCNGGNNLSIGQSIRGNQTIISQAGFFELGLLSDSSRCSFGIWYRQISPQTLVWVARKTWYHKWYPTVTNSSSLQLSQHGLLIFKYTENVSYPYVVIYSAAQLAVLLDDGNFVLRNESELDSSSVWQSFEQRTDTWLSGFKLTTETPITLQLDSNYSTTFISLVPNTTSSTLVFQYEREGKSHPYWTWYWNGNDFGSVDKNLTEYIKFSFVSDANESYFSYSVNNPSIRTRLVLNSLGEMELLMWLSNLQKWNSLTVRSNFCGVNSWRQYGEHSCKCLKGFESSHSSSGLLLCDKEEELKCGIQESDSFYILRNIKLPDDFVSRYIWNIDQCKSDCLYDCSCIAYALRRNICFIWHDNLVSLQQVSLNDVTGNDLHVRVAPSELKRFTTEKPKGRTFLHVPMVVSFIGTLTFLCIILLLSWWKCRRRKSSVSPDSLVSYSYANLRRATKNFSEELDKGGFGSVFRGTMSDLSVTAVKKLECFAGEKQFRSEVNTIGMIHHVNLIRLRGFCVEGNKRLLVYDYMPNGSLSSYLFYRDSVVLDWKTRYQIILGIARGLQYLHEKCRDCIIHCDIKPDNILLDAGLNAVVADFGLAKMLGREFTRVLTTMRGTRGYLAPEWISGVPITPKVDVYSYGMMLFEIVSGRRNLDMVDDNMVSYFPAQVASRANIAEELICLLDPRLKGDADIGEVTRVCRVACWCIQDDENHRPSMGHIVSVLEGLSELGISPIPSFLQVILHDGSNINNAIHPCISSSLKEESTNSWTSSMM